MDNGHVTKLM